MIKDSHENSLGQHPSGVALIQLLHETSCLIDKTGGNAHQRSIASQQSTGHREKRLDFDVSGRPVTYDANWKGLKSCPACFDPVGVQRTSAKLSGDDRL